MDEADFSRNLKQSRAVSEIHMWLEMAVGNTWDVMNNLRVWNLRFNVVEQSILITSD